MRVLINAVSAKMGGAATHLPHFLRGIGRLRADDSFIAYVGQRWSIPGLPDNVRLENVPAPTGAVQSLRWHLREVPAAVRATRPDVLVSLLNFGPLRAVVPHVLFQRNPLYFCPYHLRTLRGVSAVRRRLERRLVGRIMAGADRIITPSAAMREMIRSFHPGLEATRFRVVHHGFGAAEFQTGGPLPDAVARTIGEASGVKLLYATHAASHKGIDILLDAVRRLHERRTPFTLWLTIDRADWPSGVARYRTFVAEHGLRGRVAILGRIPHDAIHRVYEAADLFVFPSLCESFGFPMVEAMGSGLPIIAADTPVNREICGSAADYYPALDGAALADRLTRLAQDPARREALRAASRMRAASFSWDRHVREVWDVLAEVGGMQAQEGKGKERMLRQETV